MQTSQQFTVTVKQATATYVIPANGASNARRTYDASLVAGFDGSNWVTTSGEVRVPQAGDVIELGAGTHGVTRFRNLTGAAGNRITLRGPTDGVALIAV